VRAAALLLLALALPAWGQMYKCVDAKGVTHYTETPQPACKGKPVDIRGSPPISGAVRGGGEDFARQEADFKRRQSQRSREEAKERAALDARCKALRAEHARLSSGRRLVRLNDKGEREYVADEVREQRLAQLRAGLGSCP
jgi:hypothetical protein